MEKMQDYEQESERLNLIEGLDSKHIFIFSGGIDIVPVGNSGKYKISPGAFKEPQGDISGYGVGGKSRALAAVHINKYLYKKDRIFHVDAYQLLPKEKELGITHAEVYGTYLKKRGIENVKEHGDVGITNTFTEIVNLLKTMIQENIKDVCIIAGDYHIPRINTMLDILLYNHTPISNEYIDYNGGIRNAIVNNLLKYNGFDTYSVLSVKDIEKLLDMGIKIHIVSVEEILQQTPYNKVIQSAKEEIINIGNSKKNNQLELKWEIINNREKKGCDMLNDGTYFIPIDDG